MKLKTMLFLFLIGFSPPSYSNTKEIKCLTDTIYHEARGESELGQIAVGLTTLNRVKDKRFPSSICGVIKQNKQYSWVRHNPPIKDKQKYKEIKRLAINLYINRSKYYSKYPVLKYTYFFSRGKSKNLRLITKIGDHRFYGFVR